MAWTLSCHPLAHSSRGPARARFLTLPPAKLGFKYGGGSLVWEGTTGEALGKMPKERACGGNYLATP